MSRERAQSIGQRDCLSLHEEEEEEEGHEPSADVYCIDANVELWQSIDFRARKSRSRDARRHAAAVPPQREASFRLGHAQPRRYPPTLPSLAGGASVDTESSNDEDSFSAALHLLQSPPARQALLPHLSPTAAGADSPVHSPDKVLAMPSRLGQDFLQPLQPLALHSPTKDAVPQLSICPSVVQENAQSQPSPPCQADEQPAVFARALGLGRTPGQLIDPKPNAGDQGGRPEPETPGGGEPPPVLSVTQNKSPVQPHQTPICCSPAAASPQRRERAPSSPTTPTHNPINDPINNPINNPIELPKTTEVAEYLALSPTELVVDKQPNGLDDEVAVTYAITSIPDPSSPEPSLPSTPPMDKERHIDAPPSSTEGQHEQQPPAPQQADNEQHQEEELVEQLPAALPPLQADGNQNTTSRPSSPSRSESNNDENDNQTPRDVPQPPPPTTGSEKAKRATKKSSFTRTVNTQELPTIHAAAAAGNLEQLRAILANGAAAACSLDKHGRPPIFYAAAYSHEDCVELLIAAASQMVQLQDHHGDSTLHAAVSAGSVECVQLLLEAGQANPDCSNRDGMTPAHLARDRECLEQLFYAGGALDMLDNNGRSPLFLACALDKSDCVAFLLDVLDEASDSLARQDSRGDTALHAAACNGSFQPMLHLLQMAADPNVVNAKGLKPIDLAVQHGHDSIRQLLAEYTLHYTSTSEFDSTFFFALLKVSEETQCAAIAWGVGSRACMLIQLGNRATRKSSKRSAGRRSIG